MAPSYPSIPIVPNSFRDGIIFFDIQDIKHTKVSELMHLADDAIEEKIINGEVFGPSNKICVTGVEFVLRKHEEYNKYMKKHKKLNPADILVKDIFQFDPFITYTINCEPCVMKKDRYQWEKLFHEHYENNIVGPMRKELLHLRQEVARLKPVSFIEDIEERDRIFEKELAERSELFKKELRSRQELYEKEIEARDAVIRSLQNKKGKSGNKSNKYFPTRERFIEDQPSTSDNVKTLSEKVRDEGKLLFQPQSEEKEQEVEKKEPIHDKEKQQDRPASQTSSKQHRESKRI